MNLTLEQAELKVGVVVMPKGKTSIESVIHSDEWLSGLWLSLG